MRILINCSNLKIGGGLQVANSVCCNLYKYSQHYFIVVLSDYLQSTLNEIRNYHNVKCYNYNSKNSLYTLLTGKVGFLDNLVKQHHINVVLSVFGPITWVPKCPHFCGFARPHLVLFDSPYFQRMSIFSRLKSRLQNVVLSYFFRRGVTAFYTENEYISQKWRRNKDVYTITNYYNQVYDQPNLWVEHKLPEFEGLTLLTISSNYPHKNLPISLDILKVIKVKYPDLNIRFVFTIDSKGFPQIPNEFKENFVFIGRVNITECPSLYQQCDMMFQPSLLECFTATYPEAMRMEKPIITTDMEFARGLCGDAAVYYSPLSAEDAADKIAYVAKHKDVQLNLIAAGKKQLLQFDNYEQRTEKLIKILENISKNN